MTEADDHLAPVTQLFGARADGRRPSSDVPGDDGWARDDSPGADETSSDSQRPVGAPVAAVPTRTTAPGAYGQRTAVQRDRADVAASRSAPDAGSRDERRPPGPEAPAEKPVVPETAPMASVTALPTYAAFAAKTEGPTRVSFGPTDAYTGSVPATEADGADGAAETDDGSAIEPAESLEAAARRAENISLHALGRRGVSSREMATTLRSRDLPDEVVEAEVERLERVGLLDDATLAENLVRSKQDRKGLGKSAISSELRQRGLAQEAIETALADIDDDEEQARADEWAVKRSSQLRGLDQATAERRLNAFLMRRGYRSEVIRRAVEKALPRGGSGRGGVRFE